MILTPEEGRRLHVLTLLEGKRISLGQAAEALGLSPRQVRRLRVALRREGPTALTHGNRGRRSPRRLPAALQTQILSLARGATPASTTSTSPRAHDRGGARGEPGDGAAGAPRRGPPLAPPPPTARHRSRRPRKAQAGLLLQLDGSPFAWFGPPEPACTLVAAIDDATGTVLAATFRAQEDAAGYLELLRTLGRTVGLPAAVYTDSHGIFVRNDPHWTLASNSKASGTHAGRAALQALASARSLPRAPGQGPGRTALADLPGPACGRTPPSGHYDDAAGNTFLATTFLPPSMPSSPCRPPWPPARTARSRGGSISTASAPSTTRARWPPTTPCGWSRFVLQLAPGPQRRSYARRRPMWCSASMAPGVCTSAIASSRRPPLRPIRVSSGTATPLKGSPSRAPSGVARGGGGHFH